MVKTVSEHVSPLVEERPAAQAITPRAGPAAAAPPAGPGGRPPDDYLHPGMRLAAWVWLLGFAALFLQILSEGVIVLVMEALHRH
jgi:hypothetical protein